MISSHTNKTQMIPITNKDTILDQANITTLSQQYQLQNTNYNKYSSSVAVLAQVLLDRILCRGPCVHVKFSKREL